MAFEVLKLPTAHAYQTSFSTQDIWVDTIRLLVSTCRFPKLFLALWPIRICFTQSPFAFLVECRICSVQFLGAEALLEVMEAHPGTVKTCPGAMEAQPYAMETP
jgi:hypothetical protein